MQGGDQSLTCLTTAVTQQGRILSFKDNTTSMWAGVQNIPENNHREKMQPKRYICKLCGHVEPSQALPQSTQSHQKLIFTLTIIFSCSQTLAVHEQH